MARDQAPQRALQRALQRQSGHTLLEWLVASALGLVVLAGTLTLYRSQRETFIRSADAASMREAGAAALIVIGQHIQMAGYAPVDRPPLRARVMPGVFGCQSARPVAGGVYGEPRCALASSDADESDAIVVRYADDGVATWRNRSGQPTDCLGQGVEREGEYAVIVNQFYAALPSGREEPELYCFGNGHATPQPIVEGIERLTLRYWLRGAAEPAGAGEIDGAQWSNVVAVDLCVVVRGRRANAAKTFVDCDGRRVASPDGRGRLSLSRHLVLRNHEERVF
ncbi:PilW family protein [Trinickia soli]|uniref:PilW family protein n=1 Tax=Trinickia soli TaxID=380675 RepID=UPI001253B13C|nr:type IV pillus assembly protein [Paraburkholderia sp. T12-10]